MTDEERQLLIGMSTEVVHLFGDRDDFLVGFTAAILDLYRVIFSAGLDTKNAAVPRLRTQVDQLHQVANGLGSISLKWIADSLENEKLDAAKLLRERSVGSA
jgi:hypothetical protein